jgi:hypothetical protein
MLCYNGVERLCVVDPNEWRFFAIVGFLVTIPFAFIRDLQKFIPINVACLGTACVLMVSVITRIVFQKVGGGDFPGKGETLKIFSLSKILNFYGKTAFSIECPHLLFPIRNKLKVKREFNGIMYKVSAVVILISILLTTFSYKVNIEF